jgi:hypothetical protein
MMLVTTRRHRSPTLGYFLFGRRPFFSKLRVQI